MKCPSCGADIVDGSRFCKYCGTPISQQKEPEDKEESVQTSENIRFVNQNQIGQDNSESSEISKGCKIWFWFVLIMNAISAVSSLALSSYAPGAAMLGAVSGIVLCAGAAIILFKKKKIGFYMIVGMAVVVLIYNLTSGANAAFSIIAAIANPLISYYFVNKNVNIIK